MAKTDTRQNILKTASRLFHYNGVNGTGINEILKESGASRGSFYHYFPDGKEQMAYEAVEITCESQLEKTRALINVKKEAVDAFQYRIQALIDEFDRHKGQDELSIGLVALESWKNTPELSKLCGDTFNKMIGIYADKLISCGFTVDEAYRLGLTYQMLIDGALVLSSTRRDMSAFKEAQKQIKVIIESHERL